MLWLDLVLCICSVSVLLCSALLCSVLVRICTVASGTAAQHLPATFRSVANRASLAERALDDIEQQQQQLQRQQQQQQQRQRLHQQHPWQQQQQPASVLTQADVTASRKYKCLPRQTSVPCSIEADRPLYAERYRNTGNHSNPHIPTILSPSTKSIPRRVPHSAASFGTSHLDVTRTRRLLAEAQAQKIGGPVETDADLGLDAEADADADAEFARASEVRRYSAAASLYRRAMWQAKQSSHDSACVDSYYDIANRAEIAESTLPYQHPVTWQVSASGTHLIGHMILKKLSSQQDDTTGSGSDSGAILGLKIIGGKMTANGRLGAFVTKVKTGSAADLVGRLKPGDEVLEWNGRSLQGLTLEEVYDVVIESKNDSQVELVVQRDLRQGGMIDAPSTRHRQSAVAANSAYANDMYPLREHFAAQGRADAGIDSIAAPPTGYAGRIQIKLLYDTKNLLLIVSVLSAATLRLARTTVAYNRQQFPYLVNAYCKLYLLPDRSERSRRRSKTVLRSNDPKWNQTFFYTPIRDSDIYSRVLEVSVWDYDRRNGSELVGVCEIELATAELHDAARWYYLSFPDPASYWATYGEADTSAEDVRGYPNIRYSSTPYVNQPGSASSAAFIPPSSETGHRRSTTATGNSYLMCPPRGVDSAPTSPPDAYAGSVYAPLSASNADASLQAPSMRRTRDTFRKMHMHSASLDYDNTDRLNVYAPRSNAHSPSPSMYGREASNRSQAYDQRDFEDRRLSPASRVAGAPRNLASPAPSEPVYAEPFGRQVNFPSSMAQSNSSRTLTPPRQRILPQVPQTSRQQFAANAQLDSRRLAESAPSASTGAIKPGRSRSRTGDRRLDGDNLNSDNSETSGISEASKLSALSLRSSDVQRQQVSNIYPYAKAEIQVDERVERHRGQRTYAQYGRSASVEVDKPYAGEASGNDELNWSRVSDSGMDSTQTLPGQQRSRPNVMQDDQAKAYDNTPKSAEGDVQSESTSVTATSRSAMQPEGDANEAQQTPSISETSSQTGSVSTPKKQSGMTRKISSLVNLGKKSSSVSQLAETKNGRTSFQRSEEIGNALENDRSTLASASSTQKLSQSKKTSFGLGSMDDFIDGLGPGQVVGRQVLGSPCLGEIQIGLFERKGHLEVEVIRARNLVSKTFSKTLPNVYVKLYLMDKKTCVEKQKISSQQKSLEPRYQQTVTFMESYQNRLLQIMLWGDYGRMERKVFMGVAQVHVADLDLSTVTIGWYKLYNANSLVTGPPAMAQRASSTSVVNQTGDR